MIEVQQVQPGQVAPGQVTAVPPAVLPAFDINQLLASLMPLIMLMMVMMMIMPMMRSMAEAFRGAATK